MNKFKIGDRVSFEWHHGERRKGNITKMINSFVRIDCDDCCWMESTIEALKLKRLVKKKRECPQCDEHKARNHKSAKATDWCTNCLASNTKLNLMQLKLDELEKTRITREKLAEAWDKSTLKGTCYCPSKESETFDLLCKELGL